MFEDMTVDAVKEVLEELSDSDQAQILHWLDERHNAKWDRQMERDFAPGGPAQSLFDELNREIDEGKTLSMEEACRERKLRR